MAAERRALDAPIVAVTVLEDRAQVRREGTVALAAGRWPLRVADVAPVLSDKTLQVRVIGGAAQVADARVVRTARARLAERPEALRAREIQRRALQAARDQHEAERGAVQRELAGLARVRAQVLAELAAGVAWGDADAGAWSADLDAVLAPEAALRARLVALEHDREALDRDLADLDRLVDSLEGPGSRLAAAVELELVLDRAGEVTVALDYVTPGACWRPQHRAVLEGETLTLETAGCVWQNTGEDWVGARLALSTARASLGAEPPLLGEDVLRVRPRPEQVVVEARDQALQTTGLGSGRSEADGLPGIDDGGEVRTLAVPGTPTVPGDGRPHRLPLGTLQAAAEVDRVAFPERALAVLRRARAVHPGDRPLLAGPVELVVDGGRVGRTTLRYVAPGERLELGFGPDPALRVHRAVDRVDHPPGTLSRWARTDHRVRLCLSNLGAEPRTLDLTERVPVSEVEQVRVELDREATSTGATPDADGMVRWTLTLPPGGTAERVLAWRVEKKRDVAGL